MDTWIGSRKLMWEDQSDVCFSRKVYDVDRVDEWIRGLSLSLRVCECSSDHLVMALWSVCPCLGERLDGLPTDVLH